jgi:hypothetical protein
MNITITKQQRNFFLLCGALVVAYYVAHTIGTYALQAAYYRQQAIRAAQQRDKALAQVKAQKDAAARASAAAKAAASGTAGGTVIASHPPAVVLTALSNLSGTWKGQGALSGRGVCTLKLELREGQAPSSYSGYSTLSCVNPSVRGRANPASRMNPAAAVLTGVPESGSIRFHVDKTIEADANGCAATSFTATPFGTNQIAVQWQEGSCQGGQILLSKNGR